MAIKLKDLEITQPIEAVNLELGYQEVWLLLRFRGEPFGWLKYNHNHLPVSSYQIMETLKEKHTWNIYTRAIGGLLSLENGLDGIDRLNFGQLFEFNGQAQTLMSEDNNSPSDPGFSVLVTQSEYNGQFEPCLKALRNQHYSNFEIILIDEQSEQQNDPLLCLADEYRVRIVKGESAFVTAVQEASYDYIALTGTAAIADSGWLKGLARAFDNNPDVAACAGPHLPLELHTIGQLTANRMSPHPDGLIRFYCYNRIFQYSPDCFGSWLNSAFRKGFLTSQLDQIVIGNQRHLLFPLYYRALELGKMVVYEPSAFVRERYERKTQQAMQQVDSEIGAQRQYLLAALQRYPGQQRDIRRLLNGAKPKKKRRSGLYRYGRKVKKLIRGLKREIRNARAI